MRPVRATPSVSSGAVRHAGEVGWAILALVHLYDVTREERFRPLLDEIVDYLVAFDRDSFTGGINLSGGDDRQTLNRQIVGSFFGYQSMLEAIDKYASVTNRSDAVEWLKKLCYDLADESLQAAREGSPPGTRLGLAFAVGYERTGDERFLAQIGLLLDQLYWNARGVQGDSGSRGLGSTYRGFTRMLAHAERHGLLDAYEFPSVRKLKT